MTPSVPWVRKTGWTDPIYIALEGGEQMQKYLSLSSPVLCPTVPWLDHKGLADGTRGFWFFFPSVWSGRPILWARFFPFSVWSAVCLLFPLKQPLTALPLRWWRADHTGSIATVLCTLSQVMLLGFPGSWFVTADTSHCCLCSLLPLLIWSYPMWELPPGMDQHSDQMLKGPPISSGSALWKPFLYTNLYL